MKKKLLAFLLAAMMVAALVPTMLLPAAAIDWYNGYVTAKVSKNAISIDASAVPDEAYLNSEKIVSTSHHGPYNGYTETSSFYAYTAADTDGLYLWIQVTDQSLDKGNGYDKITTDPDTREDYVTHYDMPVQGGDKVQLFIKASVGSSAGRAIGSFEFDYLGQIRGYSPNYPKNYENVNGEKLDFQPSLVDYRTTTVTDAWIAELYLPWAALGGDFVEADIDDFISFQIGLQANNMATTEKGASGNEHKAYSYDTSFGGGYYNGMTSDHSYHGSTSASFRGTHCVPLSFAGFRTAVVTNAPVVDGKMDASYLKSEVINASPYVDNNFTAYTAATAEGYYIYADIIDDTLDKAPDTATDTGDKFQVYFQMGNRFTNRDWGYIDIDYRTEGEYTGVGNAVPFRVVTKGTFADNSGITADMCKYATTKTATGWTAELFIPFAGRMADNNFDELMGTTMAIAIQANNFTNAGGRIEYGLSDVFASRAWIANNGSSGDASGNYYCAPVYFDFDTDKGAKNIIRWANYSETDLVLDGTIDAAYNELASEVVDHTYVSSATIEAFPELAAEMGWEASGWKNWGSATVYYAFTDTDVYVFVDVVDDTVALKKDQEYVAIYFENSESIAKFALSPYNGGEYITNTTYFGKTVALPESNAAYAENDMIALKLKGTADNYTGYTVEFKLPLTETEKAALAAGKPIQLGVGLQVNDSFTNADGGNTRKWYSYNVPYGNLFWQTGGDVIGHSALPKVRLDKNYCHTWDEGTVIKEPTHHEEGERIYICIDCGEERFEAIPPIAHDWDNGTVVAEPSHTEPGKKLYICTTCGDEKTEDIPPLSEHSFGTWNDFDDEKHIHYCSCGYGEYENHTWDKGTVTEEATHTKVGTKLYICSDCGGEKTEDIPVLSDHVWGDWTPNGEYQHMRVCECGKKEYAAHAWGAWESYDSESHMCECVCGSVKYAAHTFVDDFCKDCGEFQAGDDHFDDDDHIWDAGVITTAPTHTTEGVKTYTCCCGATKTEPVAKLTEHVYGDGVITVEPTHFDYGIKTFSCICGDTYTETLDKLPDHEWNGGVITTAPTYTTDGIKTYTCPCGATKTETIPHLVDPENAVQLVISAPTALVGETVQLTVSIKNNSGFGAVAFALPIDTELFEFVSFSTSGSICRQFGICDFDDAVDRFKFNGLGNGLADITVDGLLVTITLRVKDTVEAGEYVFNTIVDKKNTANTFDGSVEVADATFSLTVTTHTCSFGDWTSYDDDSHARYCECGEAEYAAHEWDEGYVFRNPTHIKNGVMKYSCDCGKTRTESIDKLPDHEWNGGVITTAPTHLEYGVKTYTCTCKETYTEQIDKLPDHEWDGGVITTVPTHLEYGVKTYTCPCGATTTEQVAKLPDHTFGGWSKFDDNNHAHYCECGAKELEAHGWDEGTVTAEPTYVVEGEMTYKCDCGAIRREAIPTLPVTETSPKIIVDGATALANNTVKLTLRLENNPGVWGVAFTLPIDTEVFEFVSADTSESIFKQFGICGYDETTKEYKFNGYSSNLMNDITADGTLVVITLKVKDGVEAGEYKLQPKLSEKDIINAEGKRVSFAPIEGTVEVIDYILGDVNGDGYISNADVLMIFRYIYNPTMYPLTEVVADVNHDGYVSNADVLCIFRYIYNPEIYPIV